MLRPCIYEGRKALFHRWIDEDRGFLKFQFYRNPPHTQETLSNFHKYMIVPHDCELIVTRVTLALIEFEDGCVKKANPEDIRFTGSEDTQ